MLVVSRRVSESLLIGDDIVITITRVRGQTVRIAINAPQRVPVGRLEAPRRRPGRNAPNGVPPSDPPSEPPADTLDEEPAPAEA